MTSPPSIPTFEEWREKHKETPQSTRRSKRSHGNVYNPFSEPLPGHKFFRLDRKAIDKGFNKISAAVLETLSGARPQDKQLAAVQSLARRLQTVIVPETLDVAVVGEQGTGKSLAINALQHRPRLSTTSASGGACTASAIRFCYKPDAPEFADSFDAKIKFMSDEELTESIQEHIDRYYHFHFSGNVDEETYFEDQRVAKDAGAFFNVLHNAKYDREAASQLNTLLTADNIKGQNLLNATMAMAHRRIDETSSHWSTTEERTIVFKDQTIKILMEEVEKYMARCPSMPSLWPIVQSLDILLWSLLAKHGVNLRDLPGLNDENQIRTAATNTFRRKAGYEMIFARADRVTTDANVHRYIRQSIKAHGAKATILILTKKDEYLLDTNSVENVITTHMAEPFVTIRNHLDSNANTMAGLPEDDEAADAEYDDRQAYQAHLENIAKLAFIEHRAADVAEEMKAKFKDVDPNPISVFSISASMYIEWMKQGRLKQPLMSPKETGVPGVRQYLLQLCAEPNLKIYKDHAFDKMDDLLNKCRGIADVEKKDEGYALLRARFAEVVADIRERFARMFNEFIEYIIERVFDDEGEKQARMKELLRIVDGWGYGSQWNTYRACLMRKGIGWSGAAKYKNTENPTGRYNWNEDQGNVILEDMNDWKDRMDGAVETLAQDLDETIDSVCQDIQKCIETSSLPPKLRDDAIKQWEGCQKKVWNVELYENFYDAVKATHQYATTETDVRCMNAKLNVEYYKRVYDIDTWSQGKFPHRFAAQKIKMHDLMSNPDEHGRTLIDRIEHAVTRQSKKDLRGAFDEFLVEVMKNIEAFDEHISDRAPLDYKLTDADRQLREDILKRIPELETMVEVVRAKFSDEALLTEQVELSTNHSKEGEPAQKKMKVEADD
ncbi:uncharacterized protein N0V89_003201 [Didymosphaeria variabile]|uniref:P-loop containing nucleoside triphosphate hydrolase protein n=1 Tax=Didymosphaeria variabile TaxID=1932322 RepID=A0A9W8XT27_9PLEO|nr:uncharacterized protein N0V89_003201 [Didymosphaeria variabile]KAJ4358617.1 hypothetical protein N0V89_003201 [Didymosphaeria variabile]